MTEINDWAGLDCCRKANSTWTPRTRDLRLAVLSCRTTRPITCLVVRCYSLSRTALSFWPLPTPPTTPMPPTRKTTQRNCVWSVRVKAVCQSEMERPWVVCRAVAFVSNFERWAYGRPQLVVADRLVAPIVRQLPITVANVREAKEHLFIREDILGNCRSEGGRANFRTHLHFCVSTESCFCFRWTPNESVVR